LPAVVNFAVDIRSEKCTSWAKSVRVSGSSAIVVDPNDKMGSAARTASGNLAPKPMLFFPADHRAITLWRDAAAWNAGDVAGQLAVYDPKASLKLPDGTVLKGHEQIGAAITQSMAEAKGLVRAELGEYRGEPVLLGWRYEKGGTRSPFWMVRIKKLNNWVIARAELDNDPKHLAKVIPSGLMPYDPAFLFDPKHCIRTKETAYTPDGGLSILYGQLAPEGSVVKTAGISDAFKANCGADFVFEGPCVIFENQDDAWAFLPARPKPETWSSSATKGRGAVPACRRCSTPPRT